MKEKIFFFEVYEIYIFYLAVEEAKVYYIEWNIQKKKVRPNNTFLGGYFTYLFFFWIERKHVPKIIERRIFNTFFCVTKIRYLKKM